jgi:hypothetical protein
MGNWRDDVQQTAYNQAVRDYRIAEEEYRQAQQNGDTEQAAIMLRHLKYHENEIREYGQPVLTEREQRWLAARPSLLENPQKLAKLQQINNQILAAGVERNSDRFFEMLGHHFDGPTELPDPTEMIDIVSRSKYMDSKEDARKALDRGWRDVQQELARRGGHWQDGR